MKNKILTTSIVCLLLSTVSLASQKVIIPKDMTLLCITEFPTTSFIGFSNQNKVQIRLVNSNGVEYMPISSSLITGHDLVIMKSRAEALQNLGSVSVFDFLLKDCKIHEDKTFTCSGSSVFTSENGTQIEAVSLSSSLHSTKAQGIQYEQVQLLASFKIKGEYYDMMMRYSPQECGLSYNF